jgi:hypothetical protein
MEKFTESTHCKSGAHCKACRSDEQFRQSIMRSFEWDGTCPKGLPMPLPSLPRQAANLTAALARVAKAAVTAQSILAAPSTYAARAELCAACELWIPERKRCRKCGCRTDLKLRLAQERCPLGKWEKDDIA